MDIIHVVNDRTLPRLVGRSLRERLNVTPAVVVTGARQTGKSTLVQDLVPEERRFHTLDDLDVLDTARREPELLVGGRGPVTLDEVQREPDILLAVKAQIDREKRPGQFLLTGSANLLLMRSVSESLAGRASYLTLWPMTRSEQRGEGGCGIWEELLNGADEEWQNIAVSRPAEPDSWQELALRGGFPTPAVELSTARERAIWWDGYVRTYLERDVGNISNIAALPDLRRLMRGAAHRTGGILNQTEVGRDVGLAQATVHRYLNLLEVSYLLVRLPAFAVNRTKRLIKSPKVYWSDSAMAMHLAQEKEPRGEHLENLILSDLLAWRDSRLDQAEIYYWRAHSGEEVDLVIEAGDQLIPIEIKASGKPKLSHIKHLRAFRDEYRGRSRFGLLIHSGDETEWLAPDVLSVPWWRVI